jgi:hypothetical protein
MSPPARFPHREPVPGASLRRENYRLSRETGRIKLPAYEPMQCHCRVGRRHHHQ